MSGPVSGLPLRRSAPEFKGHDEVSDGARFLGVLGS